MNLFSFSNHFKNEKDAGLFSGWQWGLIKNSNFSCGSSGTYDFNSHDEISDNTCFDLASLTKVVFTVPVVYGLIYKKILNPYDKISGFFNNLSSDITIIELLSHTSGLPAWLPIYEMVEKNLSLEEKKKEVIKIISASRTNDRSKCYSDLNYILLGFIIEKITGKTIDAVFENFKKDNHLNFNISFSPDKRAPKTAFSNLRNSYPTMTVEDENCWFLGGICGHAGLFASSSSVVKYFDKLFDLQWFSNISKSLQYAGFDRPEGSDSNYGKKADNSFIGHLGFTGTAVLIDPEKKTVAALLTNCTHPNPEKPQRKERIKKCRQIFFDEVF
ncbi:MAG TPA: serine hydrolase [bacterium]|nr:serine hydrolase [bacterium]HQO90899.1 serine hydrolase [bacterium]HRQ70091.1 serine hydrolase [bacterium]